MDQIKKLKWGELIKGMHDIEMNMGASYNK